MQINNKQVQGKTLQNYLNPLFRCKDAIPLNKMLQKQSKKSHSDDQIKFTMKCLVSVHRCCKIKIGKKFWQITLTKQNQNLYAKKVYQ